MVRVSMKCFLLLHARKELSVDFGVLIPKSNIYLYAKREKREKPVN